MSKQCQHSGSCFQHCEQEYYGVIGDSQAWIMSLLCNRKQAVVVDGSRSSWRDVTSGVPQGSVIGPTLFLLYINDIQDNIQSPMKLFADDCAIYRECAGVNAPKKEINRTAKCQFLILLLFSLLFFLFFFLTCQFWVLHLSGSLNNEIQEKHYKHVLYQTLVTIYIIMQQIGMHGICSTTVITMLVFLII